MWHEIVERKDVKQSNRSFRAAAFLNACLLSTQTALAEVTTCRPPETFTDAMGRTLDLPAKIERVIPAGPPAVTLIYALAPEKLVGLISAWTERQRTFVPQNYRDLAPLPRLTHPIDDAGLAVLRAENADLVIDYGDVGSD
jgi:iron complex transport system substrate-binding protein